MVKGAPEIVMAHCDIDHEELLNIQRQTLEYQNKAMRTLAFAYKKVECGKNGYSLESGDRSLTIQAVAAISDPLR